MKLTVAIELYLEKQTPAWSGGTYINTKSTLKSFRGTVIERVGYDPDLTDLDSEVIMNMIALRWPGGEDCSTHHVNHRRIRAFFNWLYRRAVPLGDIDVFLAKKLPQPEVTKEIFTEEETLKGVALLIALGETLIAHFWLFQFRAWRRASEIVEMKWKDVDFTTTPEFKYGYYYYRDRKAKKGRSRIRLNFATRKVLMDWSMIYRQEMGTEDLNPEWFIFPARKPGGRMHKGVRHQGEMRTEKPMTHVSDIFKSALEEIDMYKEKRNTHGSRRGGLTDAHRKLTKAKHPNPIAALKAITGHSSDVTLQEYIDVDSAEQLASEAISALDGWGSPDEPIFNHAAHAAQEVTPKTEEPQVTDSNVIQFARWRSNGVA